uniref:Uncharacterized protein n=1 Tax=Eptatretus burgeri TaxID=7764 RepID=A0A8C4QWF0_EPTBU
MGSEGGLGYDDLCHITGFIHGCLATCYLLMHDLDLALEHARRSIIQDPTDYRNHLREAVALRQLFRFTKAARSAMMAHFMLHLMDGMNHCSDSNVRTFWQAMVKESLVGKLDCTLMFTPMTPFSSLSNCETAVKKLFKHLYPHCSSYIHVGMPSRIAS